MNMYTALTRTFMYDEALVRCLPVLVLGLTFTPLTFSEKTAKYCAVILFPNSIIALHGLRYCTVLIAFFGSIRTLTRCEMVPPAVHVYLACIRLLADSPLTGTFSNVTGKDLLQLGNCMHTVCRLPYLVG